jgi:hypothetical protein
VTEGHAAWITPENYQTHTRGHVAENVREDGALVAAELIVQSSDSLKRIDTRELTELSAGYTCDFDPTPGEWQGQRYDGVQRNIRYNHVALLAPGAGRAGRECGLRLDSAAAICVDEFPAAAAVTSGRAPESITTMKIRFDGKEYDLASTTDLAALQGVLDKSRTDASAATDALRELNLKFDKDKGRADGLDVELKKERESFPTRLDSAVADRVALETTASTILGATFSSKRKDSNGAEARMSDREIMVAVVRGDSADFSDTGKSDEYVRARFDLVREKGRRADGISAVLGHVSQLNEGTPLVREDSTFSADDVRADSIAETRNAWKTKPAQA